MQVIEIKEKVLGSDHTETLNIIAWPTLAYQNQGRWKEAKKILLAQVHENEKMNTAFSMRKFK